MDRIDRDLATALSHNGRATFQELGALVRLSPNTVADRVRRLQRDGIIAGFTAVIDETKLGKDLGVLSDVKLREGVERVAFAESLTHVPQVIGALRLCGDPTEFEGLVDRLKRDYGVASLNSRLILREVSVDKAKLLQAFS